MGLRSCKGDKEAMKIGAKICIFNYRMRERRKQLGLSQIQLAECCEVNVAIIQALESIKRPLRNIHRVKQIMRKVACFLDVDFDYLFPDDYCSALEQGLLQKDRKPIMLIKDVDIDKLPPSQDSVLQLPSSEDIVIEHELQESVHNMLDLLPPREASIIRCYFGFDNGNKKTYDEVAKTYGVSRERVRQIVEQGLNRGRRYGVSRNLRSYLY